MKKAPPPTTPLCSSCRKECKQPAHVLIASCPSYLPLPKDLRSPWVQMEMKFTGRQ